MTLIIENVNDDLAKAIRAMAKPLKAKVKTKRKLTINGFTPEFEKQLLQEVKETQEAYAKGEHGPCKMVGPGSLHFQEIFWRRSGKIHLRNRKLKKNQI